MFNELHFGDCFDLMVSMKPKSVDFVFTDPPYNVGKDYGTYKDKLPPDTYLTNMLAMLALSRMVSKRGVCMYVSGSLMPTFMKLMPTAHPVIIYKKAAGVAKNGWRQQYHVALIEGTPIKTERDLIDDIRLPGEGYYFRETRWKNPGLTSLILTERIISMMTKEGETVLDPYMGSGTTGEACVHLNRNFIGVDIDRTQYLQAHDRIQQLAQLKEQADVQ